MATSETDRERLERAWTEFYVQYGSAMVAWALIESELATLFSRLTNIPPDMAMQIYYASRSFKGRTDIFKAALGTCKASDDIKTFARMIAKKAEHYSDCRNKFAHDLPLLSQTSRLPPEQTTFDVLIVDGKAQFQSDKVKAEYMAKALNLEDIKRISINFHHLAEIIRI